MSELPRGGSGGNRARRHRGRGLGSGVTWFRLARRPVTVGNRTTSHGPGWSFAGAAGRPGVLMTWDPNHAPRASRSRHSVSSARATAAALRMSRRVRAPPALPPTPTAPGSLPCGTAPAGWRLPLGRGRAPDSRGGGRPPGPRPARPSSRCRAGNDAARGAGDAVSLGLDSAVYVLNP